MTTVVLLIVGLPLAWVLSRSRGPWAEAVGALVAMPLVLPPSVLGFYLLLLLGRSGPVGRIAEAMGLSAPAFSFEGLVIGSVIYSLPFMVQPVRNAIDMIGNGPLEAAATLRASPVSVFFDVVLPLARPGIVTGAVMSFAHTVGEFGVILMIANLHILFIMRANWPRNSSTVMRSTSLPARLISRSAASSRSRRDSV